MKPIPNSTALYLISQNFSLNLSTCHARLLENTEAVVSMDQNLPIEQTHFSQPAVG